MATRRAALSLISAAVAAACSPASRAMFPRGGSAAASGMTFDYYISSAGSSSNPGTLAEPWDYTVLAYGSSKQSTIAGKRIGFIGPYICPYSLYTSVASNAGSGNLGVFLGIPGGTQSSPTYFGSSNSSGYETPGACTIDFHQNASPTQGAVTYGLAIPISSIATGSSTVITLNSSAGSNPFASLVGSSVWFASFSGSDFTAIGLTPPSQAGGAAGTLYTISAVGGSSGAWTVTISQTTSGTYTPATQATIYWNYAPLFCEGLGQTPNGPFTSNFGWWTVKGIRLTGISGHGMSATPKSTVASYNAQSQISAISTGSSTTFTVSNTASSNPFAVGMMVQFDYIEGSGTLENFNYATGGGSYTVASVGGSSGAWTFTVDAASSGTFTTGTNAYVVSNMPGVLFDTNEVYDIQSPSGGEPCCIFLQICKGAVIQNCLLHDVNNLLPETAGPTGDGIETFYCYDILVQYCTIYNAQGCVWHKSWPMGNSTVQYCFLQALGAEYSWGVFESVGQTQPGFSQTVRNCIIIAGQACVFNTTDAQPETLGAVNFYNNTLYQGQNLGSLTWAAALTVETGSSTSGFVSATFGSVYNNLFNMLAGGSTMGAGEYGYIAACAGGSGSSPTNINLSLCDYNVADTTSTDTFASLATYELPYPSFTEGYSLSSWQSTASLDAHSSQGSPTYASSNLGYQYPSSNFQLQTGSVGKGAGKIGGVSGGASTDVGAWGGIDVNTGNAPAQIGSTLAA